MDGNSDSSVCIRISDNIGTNILSETTLEPGTSLALDSLEGNAEYVVEKNDSKFCVSSIPRITVQLPNWICIGYYPTG